MQRFARSFRGRRLSASDVIGLFAMSCMRLVTVGILRLKPVAKALANDPDPTVADAARWAVTQLGKT